MDGIYLNVVFLPPKRGILAYSMYVSSTQGSLRATPTPQKRHFSVPDVRVLNSWAPPGKPKQPSIFKPVSKATKAMKIGPKATQNHEKSSLES